MVTSVRTGARFGAAGAIGLWIGDLTLLESARQPGRLASWLTGLGAAFFVAVTTGVVLGGALGPLLSSVARDVSEPLARWWRRFRAGDEDARVSFTTHVAAGSVLLGVWSALAYRLPMAFALDFARPESMAFAMVLSHIGFAASLLLVWRPTLRLARRAIAAASRIPAVRRALQPRRVVGALAALAFVAVGAAWVAYGTELVALPWESAFPLVGMIAGLVVAGSCPHWESPWGPRVRRAGLAFTWIAFVASCLAAARLHPESTVARKLAFDRALSGRLGYAAWTAALDFDRDGQLNILGGGDCAPFDPHRYTGAPEIPGNGIDEDCDGEDLSPFAIHGRRRIRSSSNDLPARPTIVLVTIDALAARRVGTPDGSFSWMPHLQALSARAMAFTNCFAEGPSTRLSFPSMFTSRYDSELAFVPGPTHPHSLLASERQLQDLLDDAGYETVAVIPSAYFDRSRWPSVTRGFRRIDASAIAAGKHNAPQVTDAALRILTESRDRPLYMWVHYYDAHGPYARLPGVHYESPTEEAFYDAELTYIDREVDRLIAALDARSEPNYLIVTADHGTVFHPDPASRRGHYGSDLYTATLHVPLIMRGPGLRIGRTDSLVSTIDIVPTVADLLHLPDGPRFEGNSLLPEALGEPPLERDRALYHELNLPERAFRGQDPLELVSVRNGRWNLVLDRDSGGYELYDWTADYFERVDVYEDQARSPEIRHLRSLLSGFVRQFHPVDGR